MGSIELFVAFPILSRNSCCGMSAVVWQIVVNLLISEIMFLVVDTLFSSGVYDREMYLLFVCGVEESDVVWPFPFLSEE